MTDRRNPGNRSRHPAALATGLAIAVLSTAPLYADDTELLLFSPDPALQGKPNVMLIIDTSGSMLTEELTSLPYDNSLLYFGACDASKLYWTDVDAIPVCGPGQNQLISKPLFHCDAASAQLAGIGSYTGTMAQYRGGGPDGLGVGPGTWQYLAPHYADSPVECHADSSKHGDGRVTHLWAGGGTDLPDPFTDNPDAEVAWGSAPRNVAYTVYDGNYLNWKSNPPPVVRSRLEIVQDVAKTVLKSIGNMKVGVVRFNDVDGGAVVLAATDIDASPAAFDAAIDGLTATDRTPLSEAMYETALYWRGLPAHYGEMIDEHATDFAALVSNDPEVYRAPSWDACTRNFNIVLSDGAPMDDGDTELLAPTLPDFEDATGSLTCSYAAEGDCLDDIALYLAEGDVDSNADGEQTVTTYTIGFTHDLPLLSDTAAAGGGEYFLADDLESLTQSLVSITADVSEKSLSFAAPAVAVNAFNRTQNLNDLYVAMFGADTRVHWPGNLKKYRIANGAVTDANGAAAIDASTGFFTDTSVSFWTAGGPDGNEVRDGGAANKLPDPISRKLFTNNGDPNLGAAVNQVTPSNVDSFSDADFGLSGAAGEPTRQDIIRWARGVDILDEDNDPATTVRYAMGDPLHAQPAAVVYGGNAANPDVVVFTATNDGYLHAIDASTGAELWSFVPKELLSNFTRLYFNANSRYKQYGLDGNIVPIVRDDNGNGVIDGSDFVYILFGMRRGGNAYYALDVTNKSAPRLLWNVSYPDMGESWSTPVVARVDIDTGGLNADKAVAIVGGGYDTVHDTAAHPENADGAGAGIYFLDLATGAELWRAGRDNGADLQVAGLTRSIPTQVQVIDFSGDGYADRMYAADMGGQILRFDITNGATPANLVAGGVIAQLGAEGAGAPAAIETRRFYNAPDVSMFVDHSQGKQYVSISIGSGYRAQPFDVSALDRFYSVRDPNVFNQLTQVDYDGYDIINDADLVEVGGRKQVILQNSDRGWRFTMPPNQKVLTDSVTFDNQIFFVGFSPDVAAQFNCGGGSSSNFLYRMSVVNGDPIVNNLDALLEADADDARVEPLSQGGIAPTPTVLFPSPDAPDDCVGPGCTPPPLLCIGAECSDPLEPNFPIRTLWTQDGIQ